LDAAAQLVSAVVSEAAQRPGGGEGGGKDVGGGGGGASVVILAVGDGPLLAMAVGQGVVKGGWEGKVEVVCLQSSVEGARLAEEVVACAGLGHVVFVRAIVGTGQVFEGGAQEALVVAARETLRGRVAAALIGEPLYHALAVSGAGYHC
jgi:hypothetical protein